MSGPGCLVECRLFLRRADAADGGPAIGALTLHHRLTVLGEGLDGIDHDLFALAFDAVGLDFRCHIPFASLRANRLQLLMAAKRTKKKSSRIWRKVQVLPHEPVCLLIRRHFPNAENTIYVRLILRFRRNRHISLPDRGAVQQKLLFRMSRLPIRTSSELRRCCCYQHSNQLSDGMLR